MEAAFWTHLIFVIFLWFILKADVKLFWTWSSVVNVKTVAVTGFNISPTKENINCFNRFLSNWALLVSLWYQMLLFQQGKLVKQVNMRLFVLFISSESVFLCQFVWSVSAAASQIQSADNSPVISCSDTESQPGSYYKETTVKGFFPLYGAVKSFSNRESKWATCGLKAAAVITWQEMHTEAARNTEYKLFLSALRSEVTLFLPGNFTHTIINQYKE